MYTRFAWIKSILQVGFVLQNNRVVYCFMFQFPLVFCATYFAFMSTLRIYWVNFDKLFCLIAIMEHFLVMCGSYR